MATKSLLTITQNILNKMDSDEVNSISDTVEAYQVAKIIANVHEALMVEFDLQNTFIALPLDATTSATPTKMRVPEHIQQIDWIGINVHRDPSDPESWKKPTYVSPEDFLQTTLNRDESQAEIQTYQTDNNVTIKVYNDRPAQIWTTFNDVDIYFDAFDSSVADPMASADTVVYGQQVKEVTLSDSFIFDLPREILNYLEAEATEMCFELYADGAPRKVTDVARKARVRLQRIKTKLQKGSSTGPDYGRKGYRKTGQAFDGVGNYGVFDPLPSWWFKDI